MECRNAFTATSKLVFTDHICTETFLLMFCYLKKTNKINSTEICINDIEFKGTKCQNSKKQVTAYGKIFLLQGQNTF